MTGEYKYEILGGAAVVWNKAYSIMLSAGLMMDSKYLKVRKMKNVLFMIILYHIQLLCDASPGATTAREALSARPECADVFFSAWSSHLNAPAPVWIPIAPLIKSTTEKTIPWKSSEPNIKNYCFTYFAEKFQLSKLKVATHKAADARNELFW